MGTDPKYCSVILDQGIGYPLEYQTDEPVFLGSRVKVPLRGRQTLGTVVEIYPQKRTHQPYPLVEVIETSSIFTEELYGLAQKISLYWCTPLRKVMQVMLPKAVKEDISLKKEQFVISAKGPKDLAEAASLFRRKKPAQANLLDQFLTENRMIPLKEIASKGALKSLQEAGLLKVIDKPDLLEKSQFFQGIKKKLSLEQQAAFDGVKETINSNRFATHLLFGVTGSGKTEVYIRLIEEALSQNKGVIVLVPEIALTEQTIERFRSRFLSEKMAILHHRLSDGERNHFWREIFEGKINLVIGARSAVFSPVKNLGLIVIDEEHVSAYKQSDDMPTYHARDVAILRAHALNATVLLGSATPSFESYHNALKGKYRLHILSERPQSSTLPTVHLISMQKERERGAGIFSSTLIDKIKERLKAGEQTILFLNRRGYHTQLVCSGCSTRIDCPHCAVPLTFHRSKEELLCHLCSFRCPPPKECPSCKQPTMKFRGIGTEQVERALHALFPDAKVLRIDADTTKEKGQHAELFKQFATGKAEILVGTQMVAKGLHFPHVTLVGVLNADHQLHIPDFRSAEFTFQQLIQVAGRAGRGTIPGEVILQTHQVDSPVITLAIKGSFDPFYQEEIKSRELFSYPPFSKVAKVIFRGPEESATLDFAKTVRDLLIGSLPPSTKIYPVSPAGHAKVQDQFRFQFLLFQDSHAPLQRLVHDGKLDRFFSNRNIKMRLDIDPLSTYF